MLELSGPQEPTWAWAWRERKFRKDDSPCKDMLVTDTLKLELEVFDKIKDEALARDVLVDVTECP